MRERRIRITAYMATPVVFDPAQGLAIDAALLYAARLESGAREAAADTLEPDPRMPLAVYRADGNWCYATSLAELHDGIGTVRQPLRGISAGYVQRLVWYAVGDPAEVLRLLNQHVRGLGRHRHHGHGEVAAWDVQEADVGPVRWLWREPGVPARHIPLAMLRDWSGEVRWTGYRPPYWLPGNQAWCAIAAPIRVTEERPCSRT